MTRGAGAKKVYAGRRSRGSQRRHVLASRPRPCTAHVARSQKHRSAAKASSNELHQPLVADLRSLRSSLSDRGRCGSSARWAACAPIASSKVTQFCTTHMPAPTVAPTRPAATMSLPLSLFVVVAAATTGTGEKSLPDISTSSSGDVRAGLRSLAPCAVTHHPTLLGVPSNLNR